MLAIRYCRQDYNECRPHSLMIFQQITESGYSVTEVSDPHSLHKWLRAIKPDDSEQHARGLLEAKSEILKLRRI